MDKKLIICMLVVGSFNAFASSTTKMCSEAGFTYSWQESTRSSINEAKKNNKGWEVAGSEAQRAVCLADFYKPHHKFVPTVSELASGITYYEKKEMVIAGYKKEADAIREKINELKNKTVNLHDENNSIRTYLRESEPRSVTVFIKGRHDNGMVYGLFNNSYGFLTGDHNVTKTGRYTMVLKKTDDGMTRKLSNGFTETVPVYEVDRTALALWNSKVESSEYKKKHRQQYDNNQSINETNEEIKRLRHELSVVNNKEYN